MKIFLHLSVICGSLLYSSQTFSGTDDSSRSRSFTEFESGQVRPIVLSSDRSKLFVVNTPDSRLEIFDVSGNSPQLINSVFVGMEPVAVALKNDTEAWVVNHLSDSVSIVDVASEVPKVKKVLLVGDEPRDIVFAGKNREKAFITCSHRGQNAPFDPQLLTPGVGRADVWVFDSEKLTDQPKIIINLFSDSPRALAVDKSGQYVYAASFNSGNKTTVLKADLKNGGLEKAPPTTDLVGAPAPKTGLIVKFDGNNWVDGGDPISGTPPKIWSDHVRFKLPDLDVFEIDAFLNNPAVVRSFSGVGTTLFNIAVNPKNGHIYVSNSEALNQVRFAASGKRSSTLRGHFIENRITVIADSNVQPRHLNKHIQSYDKKLGSPVENVNSLAIPLAMEITADGKTLYVAAFGSGKVAKFNTEELEKDSFNPVEGNVNLSANISYYHKDWKKVCVEFDVGDGKWVASPTNQMIPEGNQWFHAVVKAKDYSSQINLRFTDCINDIDNNIQRNYSIFPGVWKIRDGVISGKNYITQNKNYIPVSGGPTGLALDERRERLYVYSRFQSILSVIDLKNDKVVMETPLYNPEPKEVISGRPFLYDANLSSSRGDSACASCHIFGDTDHLAWDLGNPDSIVVRNPNKYFNIGPLEKSFPYYHPMKGPMTTQSLRGLINNGPMHWRGDKTGEGDSNKAFELAEMGAFRKFNSAFIEVQGAEKELTDDQMDAFGKFVLSLKYPPNPIRNLDQSLTKDQKIGASIYGRNVTREFVNCQTCHRIDPERDLFSTVGMMNLSIPESGRQEDFKIPHLRNLYQKIGMFGSTGSATDGKKFMGDQIRGFGFNHDGATDTIDSVISEDIFTQSGSEEEDRITNARIANFLFSIGGEIAPIVGQQILISGHDYNPKSRDRLNLMMQRAAVMHPIPECDLIFKGNIEHKPRGGLFDPYSKRFRMDRRDDHPISVKDLLNIITKGNNSAVFTCVPPGDGLRMGLDRNNNSIYDADENDLIGR